MSPIRLTVVMTHPVQYAAPWFRHIAARCPEIDLTVLYAIEPTAAQQGVGFATEFLWDVPLTDGYRCRVVRPARPGDTIGSESFWGLNVPEIGGAVRESEPDVVLLPGWHSITLLRALWACRRDRIPVLYRGDSHLATAPSGWRRPVWTIRTWLLLRLFAGYLSVGRKAEAYLRRFVPPSRIFEVPHAVDNDFFARGAAPYRDPAARATVRSSWGLGVRDFVVLFVGKLEAKKRPVDLIQAIAHQAPGASLLVVGSGGLHRRCREEAERLGVNVTWAGFLNQSELGRAYAAADCLVLPSDGRETWGLVVNEALATGLPCVVSDEVGGAPDLILRGETGEVFPMGDVSELAAAIGRIRARVEGGHDWAPACVGRAAVHSLERATSGLAAACRAVKREHSRPRPPRVVACCAGMVVVGGLERVTFEVLRGLRERGAAVHCIVNSWENHRIVALAEGIGASWSIGHSGQQLDRRARDPRRLARFAGDIARASLGLLREAWRARATHILIPEHVAALGNGPALALLRLAGVAVILHVHNAPAPGVFYRRLWRVAVNPVVDRFVCCSQDSRRCLLAHGVPARKVSVIHNAVSPRPVPDGGTGPRDPCGIIYVGQVIPEKGLDLLLDALGVLVSRNLDAYAVVVGTMDGWVAPAYVGYRERVSSRARAPDLDGRVRFLGWRDDVPALLERAGVHCCPSRPEMREGLPLVCLEAKLHGLPSVVFPVGPFPEIVSHGLDGWICRDVSAAALAEGLEYFLADPERRERAGHAARASAGRFDPHRFATAWWDTFGGGVDRP